MLDRLLSAAGEPEKFVNSIVSITKSKVLNCVTNDGTKSVNEKCLTLRSCEGLRNSIFVNMSSLRRLNVGGRSIIVAFHYRLNSS
jgi:hypothetical protein